MTKIPLCNCLRERIEKKEGKKTRRKLELKRAGKEEEEERRVREKINKNKL